MNEDSRPALCLRWHLSRIYEDERFASDEDHIVHVTVHAASKQMLDQLETRELEWFRFAPREERSWWNREESIEGWVRESTLLDSLERRNVFPLEPPLFGPGKRAVAEEMVLLQVSSDKDRWRMAVEIYAGGAADLPQLTDLAASTASRWMDMTKTARRTSKARYLRALREAVEGKRGEPYESK